MNSRKRWQLVFFLATLLSIGLNYGPANAGEKMIDGVLHVQNSSTPTQGVVNLKMKELWSAGGDDDDGRQNGDGCSNGVLLSFAQLECHGDPPGSR